MRHVFARPGRKTGHKGPLPRNGGRFAAGLLPLALLPLLSCGFSEEAKQLPYNVILVMIDTLRADHLSSYGYPRNTSPHLDAFGRENLLFQDARSQAACTSPSVSSLLTSRSPLVLLDQPRGHIGIPKHLPSLAEILAEQGYWTLAVSASPIVRKTPSEANRFGEFDRGFALFSEKCFNEDASCINEEALQLLATVTQPFFLYLHYMDPHGPYRPPPHFERPFSKEIHQPDVLRDGRAEHLQAVAQRYGRKISDAEIEHLTDLYDDEIAYLDRQMGQFLAALQERNMLENSIVVIASDHGEAFGEQGYLGHCRVPVFEAMVRTPLMMSIPGVPSRGPIAQQAQNIDIVPTLLDYLDVATEGLGLEGRSLRGAIEGNAVVNPYVFSGQGVEVAVSDPNLTLTLNVESGETRLFDRTGDPEHRHDVANQQPESAAALQQNLDTWMSPGSKPASREAIARDARRLEDELRALGYIQTPGEKGPEEVANEATHSEP